VPLSPAEIHAEEHLGPVGCLRPASAGTDRQKRAAFVVLPREQELCTLALEVALQGCGFAVELGRQFGIAGLLDELESGNDIAGPPVELAPQLEFGTEAIGLAEGLLCGSLVIPEAGPSRLRVERGDALGLGV
jgi:hypothetical protein